MQESIKYPGNELVLFENAINWKKYFSSILKPFIGGMVAECGAGMGSSTVYLNEGLAQKWILAEPDHSLVKVLQQKVNAGKLPQNCEIISGTLSVTDPAPFFDTIIYIDVLEHIEKDREELQAADERLKPGGHLIILSPAFPSLFSPFDEAIGHFRRYKKETLNAIIPAGMNQEKLVYLDTCGFFLSYANHLLLKQQIPKAAQIGFWDRYLVPVSKITDRIFNYSFGKSILGIWKKK
jgi:cyclopropane fatty-acyl-phospholipid synthase-like methyltransferase